MKTTSIQTCLLVTDDPDDHNTFAEAIAKISENTIVLIVIDSVKAAKAISTRAYLPDFVIIDLSMYELEINTFLARIREQASLAKIPILAYGEPSEYAEIENRESLMFFAKEYEFSRLQNVLRDFIEDRFN